MDDMTEPLEVRSLVCRKNVEVALVCLDSLIRFSAEPLKLIIHDDGSLTENDVERLSEGLGNPEIISRPCADERMEPLLEGYPMMKEVRGMNPLTLKLMDCPMMSDGDYAFCDPDVLFTRPFTGLFKWPDDKVNALFMKDHLDSYVFRLKDMVGDGRIRTPSKVNTGIIFLRKGAFNPGIVEEVMGRLDYRRGNFLYEQTCWAVIAGRVGCMQYDSEQVKTTDNRFMNHLERYSDAAAIHLTGGGKQRLNELMGRMVLMGDGEPEEIKTIRPCSMDAHSIIHILWHFNVFQRYERVYKRCYEGTIPCRTLRRIREGLGV
ncbi:MAG: hypothetical protein ABIH11_00730 [Candidatus Altiarchaeota archaeon]